MQRFTRRFLAACAFFGIIASTGALAEGHPTIRAMSGATPVSELPAGKSALLVIDFQNEYFTGRMPIPDGDKALANTRELIEFADRHNMPVYHVQHIAPAGSVVFAIDGKTVKFHPEMLPRGKDTVLQKSTVSVFASTDLGKRLKRAGIKNLIICGLMTHASVAGTARDAAPLGYKVIVASDASATRDITRVNGDQIDKDALHKAALAEIEDTFGDVMTTAQILKMPVR
ncbi:cysteine hydrolase family protein [Pseudomonas chlororaphis]|uniref:cysteine hydrolase family protein n=1 Tax=Pseudomonas chlororaphis TaxID=587753 RepID=UPI0003D2D30E|nr:cysteine hydrolase family protein [Pseudomonas chlororaphis]AZD30817.1 Isochorismatase [Pseudomonas chlororaphis]ETD34943.1 cysteine hydrolase [Pseudomonas chlororaphis subsp. aurantiaca PB-St2]QFS56166.1 isochorismatase family protein [Pseudomonas chlororaphis subsp. aurantiaca]